MGKGVCNTTTPLTVAIILLRIDSKNPILDTKFTIGRFFLDKIYSIACVTV